MDGEDIEARAAVHDATRVTVHYLDVFHAVLFPSCSPQFLFSLYLAGRRLDGVHETRAIYRSRNGTSQGAMYTNDIPVQRMVRIYQECRGIQQT